MAKILDYSRAAMGKSGRREQRATYERDAYERESYERFATTACARSASFQDSVAAIGIITKKAHLLMRCALAEGVPYFPSVIVQERNRYQKSA